MNCRFLLGMFAITGILLLPSLPALAQNIPSSVDPSRVPEQIVPLQSLQPSTSPVAVSNEEAVEAPPGADKIKFVLEDIDFKGLTVYSEDQVAQLYQDKIGQPVTLTDIYKIANRLTVKYRNDGYILTRAVVPPQKIEKGEGHVLIRIVTSAINDIKIQDKTGGRLAGVLEPYMDKIKAVQPFNLKTLERYLLLISDLPGITAHSVLSPAKAPGATDITIIVDRKPYDVTLEADNRGSRYIGPLQLNSSVRFNDMLGTREGISLQYATAPRDDEMNYGSVSVMEPLGYEGTQLTVSAGQTKTHPGFTLSQFDIDGVAKTAEVAVMQPFIRSPTENLYTTARFDYLDSNRTDNIGDDDTDRLSVLRLGSTYQRADAWGGSNSVAGEISQGLPILGSTPSSDPDTTRPGADDTFWKATTLVSRLQPVNSLVQVFVSGEGQYTPERLLTSEQFGLGGINFGSAYDSSELTGDKGLAGRGELRLNDPFHTNLPVFQPYGFYDIGKVWDPGNTDPSLHIASLADTGIGLRFSVNTHISGAVEWAFPLTRDVGTTGNEAPRLFGMLVAKF